jgi:hypothetical protein
MRILAGVASVYLYVDMSWAGRLWLALVVGLPVALDAHARGMARVRAYEQRRRRGDISPNNFTADVTPPGSS